MSNILIVGTVPYNKRSTSRAFDAYFHFWEKDKLAQVFSNAKKPCKGHCKTLYQITDHAILKRWFTTSFDTGRIYSYDELEEEWETSELEVSRNIQKAYTIGGKHTSLTHLLRGILWRKKFWCTKKFNEWLDDFKPDCVFLSFSDDYFIPQIALYVAEKYNIPIVSSIGDDYYFNTHFSLSPFYFIYKNTYRALIRKVFRHRGSAIYISDKIRDKYNSEFGLDGETVYLTSDIKRKDFNKVNTENPKITYFGNIRMGRNKSLIDISKALSRIDKSYVLEVYSGEYDKNYYSVFDSIPNINYGGSIPYSEVQEKMSQSDITVIVEGFSDSDVSLSRYSLSTKAADSLASGAAILAYGSSECGIIEYMESTEAAWVCIDEQELVNCIRDLLSNADLQKERYIKAIEVTKKHHNIDSSCATFKRVVEKAISKGE